VSETHPTRVLREEHQRILAVADVLEGLLDQATGGDEALGTEEATAADGSPTSSAAAGSADYDRIGKCIRFIRLFADACHHGKEEDLLFPALQDEGLPGDSGPIAVMLHEHRLGRRFASTMADNVDEARSGDADAWKRLERAGRDYVGLIRGHILKEDNVLFDMADQMVTGPACTMLCRAYDETGEHTFDGCTKAELEELGRELVGE
jgi:hemerythrin-like domain-containing protein